MAPTGCPFPCSCVFKVDFEYWFNPLATNVCVIQKQSIDLQGEFFDWFLYDRNIDHNWVLAIFPALDIDLPTQQPSIALLCSCHYCYSCATTYLPLLPLLCYQVSPITTTLVLLCACHYYRSCATLYLSLLPLLYHSEPAITTSIVPL